jgi:two-component system, OmpR family, sensor histidine kinase MtrB
MAAEPRSSSSTASGSTRRRVAARIAAPPQARRLQVRSAVATGLVALLASAALSVIAYQRTRNTLLSSADQDAREKTFQNARFVRRELAAARSGVATSTAATPAAALATPPAQILRGLRTGESTPLLLRNGQWFAGRSFQIGSIPDTLRDAAARGVWTRQRFEISNQAHLAVAVPVVSQSGASEATYVEVFPIDDIDRTLGALAASLSIAALIASLAGGIVGVLLAQRLVRPLRQLAQAANRIAGGDLRARLDPKADRALAPFINSFNTMARSLEERRDADTRFAANVSHEMRSPLAAMRNSLNLVLRRKEQMPERAALGANMLEEQLDRFERMVLDLLEIGRMDAGSQELVTDLVDLGELVTKMVPVLGNHSIQVIVGGHRDARLVEIDRRRFERVLSNLLENAKRHAEGAEQVVVEPAGSAVLVHVDDRGPGVSEDDKERIFERFTRGAHARHGTGSGLGLALVTDQLALMGGSVLLSDRPGGGSRFTVSIPRTAP